MSESMIERIRDALIAFDGFNGPMAIPRETRARYEARARAAIEAMREPTPEMVAAINNYSYVEQGHVYDEYDSDPATLADGAAAEIWETMIAAAAPHKPGVEP